MKTQILHIDNINLNQSNCIDTITINKLTKQLVIAGKIIRSGGLVVFPTETVYGLGGDALNSVSSTKIYQAKGRPSDNPLIIHVSNTSDIEVVASDISNDARMLIDNFMPGPITLIMNKTDIVPYETTGGLDTVAVRMPCNIIAREFIKTSGGFVAAPSANLSGKPSTTDITQVIRDLDGRVDMIIDGGNSTIGLESTIVDTTTKPFQILRPGYITLDDIRKVVPDCIFDPGIVNVDSHIKPKAPGMKYRHYAPNADLKIVKGNNVDVSNYIHNSILNMKYEDNIGIIYALENTNLYTDLVQNSNIKLYCIGSLTDGQTISNNLYRILRDMDDSNINIAFSESFELAVTKCNNSNIGVAIMNRLNKAAGNQIIEV